MHEIVQLEVKDITDTSSYSKQFRLIGSENVGLELLTLSKKRTVVKLFMTNPTEKDDWIKAILFSSTFLTFQGI
jgi:hypothetical protein